ncbi:MAG TPA: right-handed parallel beta-helix repeat-containing protein [Candidatus Saccharimonadales bacterium]|nr:right-handed parallel beta-helix repeat-containing protein [Candidatus Saccharimonadales bacterium]
MRLPPRLHLSALAPLSAFRLHPPWLPLAAAAAWACLACAPAGAATLEVAPAAGHHPIQTALDRAHPGDTVLVAPGDYEERIVLPSGVTLRSRDGAAATRLLGDLRGSVVLIQDADSLTRLEGFTVSRGRSTHLPEVRLEGGGGVLAYRAAVRLRDNIFTDNQLEVGLGVGGGVALWECPAVLERNVFDGNSANGGGGLYARACSLLVVRGNRFVHNHAVARGGGVELDHGTQGLFEGNVLERNDGGWGGGLMVGPVTWVEVLSNTVVANHAEHWGGGIFLLDCRTLVTRNLLAENYSGFHGGGLASGKAAFPDLRCNLGWHNVPGDFVVTEDSTEVPGSADQLQEDPGLCSFLTGDFHPAPGGPADRAPCGLIGALPAECPRAQKLVR